MATLETKYDVHHTITTPDGVYETFRGPDTVKLKYSPHLGEARTLSFNDETLPLILQALQSYTEQPKLGAVDTVWAAFEYNTHLSTNDLKIAVKSPDAAARVIAAEENLDCILVLMGDLLAYSIDKARILDIHGGGFQREGEPLLTWSPLSIESYGQVLVFGDYKMKVADLRPYFRLPKQN